MNKSFIITAIIFLSFLSFSGNSKASCGDLFDKKNLKISWYETGDMESEQKSDFVSERYAIPKWVHYAEFGTTQKYSLKRLQTSKDSENRFLFISERFIHTDNTQTRIEGSGTCEGGVATGEFRFVGSTDERIFELKIYSEE